MDLLTVATAGSVDDGKSTLIGRLLHDSKAITDDQLDGIHRASRRRGSEVDLALLTDGLRAEREQGITIDVAYRHFATARRAFVIADSPGHVQYTRNMVCAASIADVAVVLVDARNGLTEQSRRHLFLLALLGVPHLVPAVNKMDLVGHSEEVFRRIRADCEDVAARLGVAAPTVIPVCALTGDNVVRRGAAMPWHDGPTLLAHLENVHVAAGHDLAAARFPVQHVVRPRSDRFHDYRGYAGTLAGGVLRRGDDVVVLPSGQRSRIVGIDAPGGPADEAFCPMSVIVRLADDLDVGRGDLLCHPDDQPTVTRDLDAVVCWMSDQPLTVGARLLVKHTTRWARAVVTGIDHRIDVTTLDHRPATTLRVNDIGRIHLRTGQPVVCDPYTRNRATGGFILVDPGTNHTVAGGVVVEAPSASP